MIDVKGVVHSYDTSISFLFPDFKCYASQEWLLLGDSGCGKTTFMHIMAGLIRPKKGTVIIHGQDLFEMSETERDAFRGAHIGIVFQQAHLIDALTVHENLIVAQYMAGRTQDLSAVDRMLERLEVHSLATKRPSQLSLGEKQRVAIARSLINNPKVILADEPTSSLDDANCERVYGLLKEQSIQSNASLVIITHDGRLKKQVANQLSLNDVKQTL